MTVTGLLQQGANAVGAVLGDGWYRGTLPTDGPYTGNSWDFSCSCILFIVMAPMHSLSLIESWKASKDGAIRMCDNYNGETYDATKNLPDGISPVMPVRAGKTLMLPVTAFRI